MVDAKMLSVIKTHELVTALEMQRAFLSDATVSKEDAAARNSQSKIDCLLQELSRRANSNRP